MLSSVGHQLRAHREHRGLTLQDCAHKTRIPVDHLASLESDDLAVFGSTTYSCSFLRLYAGFLGLEVSDSLGDLASTSAARKRRPSPIGAAYGLWTGTRTPGPAATIPAPSPLPALAALLVLFVTGASFWGHHLAQEWTARERQRAAQIHLTPAAQPSLQPIYVKAIPVPEPGIPVLFTKAAGNNRFVE